MQCYNTVTELQCSVIILMKFLVVRRLVLIKTSFETNFSLPLITLLITFYHGQTSVKRTNPVPKFSTLESAA
jgi:hypothetical protein